jgi:hypothetical protein
VDVRLEREVIETVKTTNYFPLPFLMRAALTVFGLPDRFIPAGMHHW